MIYDVNVIKYAVQCHEKDIVLDRRDGRVADTSGFNGESCAGDRVQFRVDKIKHKLPMVRQGDLNCVFVALWRGNGPQKLAAPIKGI